MSTTTKRKAAEATKRKNQDNNNRRETQRQIVIKELKKYPKKGITAWDMITKYHITRLSGIIFVLKKQGFQISTDLEYSDGTHYARYRLVNK